MKKNKLHKLLGWVKDVDGNKAKDERDTFIRTGRDNYRKYYVCGWCNKSFMGLDIPNRPYTGILYCNGCVCKEEFQDAVKRLSDTVADMETLDAHKKLSDTMTSQPEEEYNNKQNNNIDIMVDLETLGVEDDAFILQIGAKAFHLDGSPVCDHVFGRQLVFNQTIMLPDKVEFETKTLHFWLDDNNIETFKKHLNRGSLSTEEALRQFIIYLEQFTGDNKKVRLWSNGSSFDIQKIRRACSNVNLYFPIQYNMDRDVRSILDLASDVSGISPESIKKDRKQRYTREEHDALNDVYYQIEYVQKCYDILDYKRRDQKKIT